MCLPSDQFDVHWGIPYPCPAGNTYVVSLGYRKINGDKCNAGEEDDFLPRTYTCPSMLIIIIIAEVSYIMYVRMYMQFIPILIFMYAYIYTLRTYIYMLYSFIHDIHTYVHVCICVHTYLDAYKMMYRCKGLCAAKQQLQCFT